MRTPILFSLVILIWPTAAFAQQVRDGTEQIHEAAPAGLEDTTSRRQRRSNDQDVIETFDVARDGDALVVPVELGGKRCHFMVDTGCTVTVVDKSLEEYLIQTLRRTRLNRKTRLFEYDMPDTFVGASRMPATGNAICLDLSQVREASGYDIRGMLGMSFLKAHVIRVDFDAGTLSLLKAAPASAGSPFRLSYNDLNLPVLKVEIASGETVAFVVDTGTVSTALKLRSHRFDDLVENGRLELIGPPALIATIEGNVRSRKGLLDKLCLGDFKHEQIIVGESGENLMGLGLLSRYVVTFDFPNDRLYLKRGKRFAEPDQFGWCGMPIGRIDGKTRIKEVQEDSAADAAGLKAGDEILRIDGKDASSLSLFEVRKILHTGGRHVRLNVDGPGGRREVGIRVSRPVVD